MRQVNNTETIFTNLDDLKKYQPKLAQRLVVRESGHDDDGWKQQPIYAFDNLTDFAKKEMPQRFYDNCILAEKDTFDKGLAAFAVINSDDWNEATSYYNPETGRVLYSEYCWYDKY